MTERTDERLQTLFTRVFMMILIRYHHEYIMGGVELNKIATMVWETREMGER